MSTDRELLEMAAKAAEINLRFLSGVTPFCDGPGRVGEWNPLTDDGDALRLAVKLDLDIERRDGETCVWSEIGNLSEKDIGDPYAATRRAIVRAAAEIGRSM